MSKIKEVLKVAADKISLDNFIEMHNCLKEINDKEKQYRYKDDFKDLIQLIIDYLIFGDKKKDQVYFDNFCELDFMKEFIVASKSRNMDILLQIIKSMSALILTISNKASLFYIFSNNFINDIITNDDIQDSNEDFLSFYVNFLKSLSLKIDATTIQLFFQKEKNSFPLLENALKLYNNDDSMIKNVVRNIFLKFVGLSKEYKPLKDYLLSLPILKYFCFLSCRLTDMTIEINHLAGYNILYNYNLISDFDFNYDKLKGIHDDLIDEILYLNDILSINDTQISFVLLNSLLYYYICPLLLGSIINYRFFFYDNEKKDKYIRYMIAPEIALYMLTLFLSNIKNDSLLNILCCLLFKYKINEDIINKFVNVQFNDKYPIFPSSYCYFYKEQNYKEKDLTFVQYITYNFNEKFICNLIMKPNNKFYEVAQLCKKYEENFNDSTFDPYNNYENIFNDIYSKFNKNDKKFMRDYHNTISMATGIKSGLSENENENNVLKYLNNTNNMIINPIRKAILEDLFKCGFEIVNFGINILIYSMFYNIMIDENNDMNKSLSRKFLYYECKFIPYELYLTNNIINRNIIKENENLENDENNIIINLKKDYKENNELKIKEVNENSKEIEKNEDNKKEENEEEKKEDNENKDNYDKNEENLIIIKDEEKIIEKEVQKKEENEEKEEKEKNEENKKKNEEIDIKESEIETKLLLFKTEIYELKYKEKEDIYSHNFIFDKNDINNLINLIRSSNPYCSLELLLNIYNIKFLSSPLQPNKNENEDNINNENKNEIKNENIIENKNEYIDKKENEDSDEIKNEDSDEIKNKIIDEKDIISNELLFSKEHTIKLIDAIIEFIQKIKYFILNNISFKYISFESFENAWNTYKNEYSFNQKNLIIKYILTPYYICIPSATINVEDFPFKSNNNKYTFETYLLGYLALKDLLNNNKTDKFPLENGNFEYKPGDIINFENINIHSSKFKLLKVLLKKANKNEFEECTLFVNKNSIIFGKELKEIDNGMNNIKIRSMHPLRELEICLDRAYSNSLQIYFKKNNYIIECESNEKRKQIKIELEQKRNEFRKWELDKIFKLLDSEEKKYKEFVEKYKFNFYFGGKVNVEKKNEDEEDKKEENKEQLFEWE